MTTTPDRTITAPVPDPENERFFEAAAKGEFLVKHCRSCGRHHWYPRGLCPYCFSDETEWRTGSGTGTIYSYTVLRRAKVPYVIAYVTLDEGPSMLTNLSGVDPDEVRIGQRVQVDFAATEGEDTPPVPVFRPL